MKSLRLILTDPFYFAPVWVFASINILVGTWVLYIPHIKTNFQLNDSEVGIALFSLAVGLLISFPFVPFINQKIGVGRSTCIGIILYSLCINIPFWAGSYLVLCLGLGIAGVFVGITDISMNALIAKIENDRKDHIMSTAHGFYSLGGFVGASIGSFLMIYITDPRLHMILIAIILIASNLFLFKYYFTIQETELTKEETKQSFKSLKPLIGLAIVGFIIMTNEGAIEHWSNLFLVDIIQTSENKAGLGFIAFSLCMTIGRFLGDNISKRIGSIQIILIASFIAVFGYIGVFTTSLTLSIIGFGVIGLGLSVIVPEVYRLAGNFKGVRPSQAIAFVSGVGFAGFLLGPLILGLISDWSNLVWSFGFLFILILISILITVFKLKKDYLP